MKMLLLLFLFGCLNASAQEIPKKYATVKKEIDRINADSSLMKVELENEEFLEQPMDGGGSLTGFFNAKEIQKITRVVFLCWQRDPGLLLDQRTAWFCVCQI